MRSGYLSTSIFKKYLEDRLTILCLKSILHNTEYKTWQHLPGGTCLICLQFCRKVFFLNPRRKGKKTRRIGICVPHCLDENVDTVQQLSAYYVRHSVKLCRYDIVVDDYGKQYGKDGRTSIDDVSCPDLPRTVG